MTNDADSLMRPMTERLVPPPSEDPVVNALMLADLGQKILGAIASTKLLGHSRLAHTSVYVHSDDPTVCLVDAVLDGRIERVEEALDSWRTEGRVRAEREIEARRGRAS